MSCEDGEEEQYVLQLNALDDVDLPDSQLAAIEVVEDLHQRKGVEDDAQVPRVDRVGLKDALVGRAFQ